MKRGQSEELLTPARVQELQCDVVRRGLSLECSVDVTHTRDETGVQMYFFVPPTSLLTLATLRRIRDCFDPGVEVDVGWAASKAMLSIRCTLGDGIEPKRRRLEAAYSAPSAFDASVPPVVAQRLRDAEALLEKGLLGMDRVVVSHARVGRNYVTSARCDARVRLTLETMQEIAQHASIDDVWVGWDDAAVVLTAQVKPLY